MNLGLRYQAFTPWVETNDLQSNYNMATGVELANQTEPAGRSTTASMVEGTSSARRFCVDPLGNRTVIRGAFTISSYLEGTAPTCGCLRTRPLPQPRSTPTTTQHCPARIPQTAFRHASEQQLRTIPASLAPFSTSGIPTFSRLSMISGTGNPAPILGRHHVPDWLRRSACNALDGAVLLYPKRMLPPALGLRRAPPSPFFAQNPTFYNTLSTSPGTNEWQHDVQLAAGRAPEDHGSRIAVSGLLHLLRVHV